MNQPVKGKKIFYGWWILLAAFLSQSVAVGIVIFTFGVFVKPLAKAFDWTRGEISIGMALLPLANAIAGPIYGRWVDKIGPKMAMLTSAFLMGVILSLFRYLTPNLWHFLILCFLLGISAAGLMAVAPATMVSQWFRKKRGLALGIMMVGVGVGGLFFPPFTQYLISKVGIFNSYAVLGIFPWLILLPLIFIIVKRSPESMGLLPDGETPQKEIDSSSYLDGMTRGEALRTRSFWLLVSTLMLVTITATGFMMHLIPFFSDLGYSPTRAASFMSFVSLITVLGRLSSGYLVDRLIPKYVASAYFLCFALGISLLISMPMNWTIYAALFFFGLALGSEIDLIAYLTGHCFGFKSFGEIYGYIFASYLVGAIIGPLFMGFVFDATGSYNLALTLFIPLPILAIVGLVSIRPFKKKEILL